MTNASNYFVFIAVHDVEPIIQPEMAEVILQPLRDRDSEAGKNASSLIRASVEPSQVLNCEVSCTCVNHEIVVIAHTRPYMCKSSEFPYHP